LTSKTNPLQDVLGTTESWGAHPGGSYRQPVAIGETKFASDFQPPRVFTPIYTVSRLAPVEHLNIMPRSGDEPLKRVTENQARSLMALALVDPVCKSRRGIIVALRIRLGVSVADINAALRLKGNNKLPIAEDNRTIRRVYVAGGGVYYEPMHVGEWDDGRDLDGRRMADPPQPLRLTRHGNGED
jgi:hypothetical protein